MKSMMIAAKDTPSPADESPLMGWFHDLALTPWQQTWVAIGVAVLIHLIIKLFVLRGLRRLAAGTENDLDDRLVAFMQRFYLLVLLFVLFLVCLRIHGIPITPLLASAGIAGIAIGMAAKETLSDILAGIFLIADRPIRIGDRVKIESIGKHWGGWGDIVDLGLRRTRIRNTDGVIVNYPNSLLANSIITNFSFEDRPVRVRVRFQLNYNTDLEHASEVARQAIEETEPVLSGTAEIVVRSLWDDERGHVLSGILLEGRYKIEDVRNRTKIRSLVLKNITKAFQREKISLASPRIRIEQVDD